MKHLILFSLLSLTFVGKAQVTFKNIENYGPEIIRSGDIIYSVTSDDEGILYFATDKGVLVYDGQDWQVVTLGNELGTRSVQYDSLRDRVWVGGIGTFGYLQSDAYDQYQYISISDDEYAKELFKKVWQIYFSPESVTFTSY